MKVEEIKLDNFDIVVGKKYYKKEFEWVGAIRIDRSDCFSVNVDDKIEIYFLFNKLYAIIVNNINDSNGDRSLCIKLKDNYMNVYSFIELANMGEKLTGQSIDIDNIFICKRKDENIIVFDLSK